MTDIIHVEFLKDLMETEYCFHADPAFRLSFGQTCPELSCLLPTSIPRARKKQVLDERYVTALEWLHSV